MRKIILTLLFLSIALFGANDKEIFKVKTVNGKELTFKGTDGGMITSPYEGKIVFLEFWGTWCGPCLLSIPHHEAMQEKYKNILRIISVETTPSVTDKDLQKFVSNTSQEIDMSKVKWFLDNKAKSPQAKKYLSKPVKELEEFKKSGKKITYDLVSSSQGKELINYIAQRARWQGGIPFLIAFDKKGDVIDIVQGMPTKDRLEAIIKQALPKKDNQANKELNTLKK